MKKLLLSIAAALLLTSGVAYAASGGWSLNGVVGNSVVVAKDKVHEGSFYAAGQTVRIEGEIRGDLYCAAQKVEIIGKVDGDVLCAAQTISISGTVGDDVRSFAQILTVDQSIGGDLSVFGQSVSLGKDATVDGDLNGAAQNLDINGTVVKNLRFGGESLTLTGQVKGVSDIAFDRVDVSGNFQGDVFYASAEKLPIQSNSGKVVFNQVENQADMKLDDGDYVMNVLFTILSMGLFSLIIALIIPRFLERSKDLVGQKTANVIVFGMLGVFVLPIVTIIAMFSVVGLPIGFALIFAWLLLVMLSGPFFAYFVGSLVAKPVKNVILRMLIGSAIVLVLYLIPIVNILAALAAVIVGAGMVVQGLTNGYKKPSYNLSAKPGK